jgi:uracil-DNA glycosylase
MTCAARFFDPHCARCARLHEYLTEAKQKYPGYHAAPVPSLGPVDARLLIVGLAPGLHGANRTGRPFTGDHAGILLYTTLHKLGLASQAVSIGEGDGLALIDARITNAVKCAPPANKPLPKEIAQCNEFLAREIEAMPRLRVVLALGRIAHDAVLRAGRLRPAAHAFAHGKEQRISAGVLLIDSFHCSRYNTQTRRLTTAMFEAVIQRAVEAMNSSDAGAV